MTSHSRCAKDSASCDTKFCLLREHQVLADVLLKNFVAAAVFSVCYFLNVVEEFYSYLSKPEGSVYHFGLYNNNNNFEYLLRITLQYTVLLSMHIELN